MVRAGYMAITLVKTWWWSFPRRRHRLRLATHPCPYLLFKGCWSGSQHVLSSRERDLTGKGEKTEKTFTPAKGTVWLPAHLAVDYRGKKLTSNKVKRGKKLSEMYSCVLSNSSDGFVACFHTSLLPITTESCSEVALWCTLIHFRSLECWNLGFVQWSGFGRTLPEAEAVCASKTEFLFTEKEIIISQV